MSALTPEAVADLVDRLESHMGLQDTAILLADCREAAAVIRALLALLQSDPQP